MTPTVRAVLTAAVSIPLFIAAQTASAQKAGGILRAYHRENPPSASIHEEATISTLMPFMAVFNNLVLFDQQVKRNSRDDDRAGAGDGMGLERRRQDSSPSSCARA